MLFSNEIVFNQYRLIKRENDYMDHSFKNAFGFITCMCDDFLSKL